MLVTITNEFHNTSATVRVGKMSAANAKRVAKKLCGVSGCTCGGPLGHRGRQKTQDGLDIEIIQITFDGDVEVRLYNETKYQATGNGSV